MRVRPDVLITTRRLVELFKAHDLGWKAALASTAERDHGSQAALAW